MATLRGNKSRFGLRLPLAVAATAAVLLSPQSAKAQTFTATGTQGGHTFSATAVFQRVGNQFHVTLTNLSTGDTQNGHVLTGLFWNGASSRSLTPVTAFATPPDSTVVNNPNSGGYTGGDVVAQHWGYTPHPSVSGYSHAVGASSLSTFGPTTVFAAGGQLPTIGGSHWGLVGTGTQAVNGGQTPFVMNSASFVLGLKDAPTKINTVRFQYGTKYSTDFYMIANADTPSVPEGSSLALLGSGMIPVMGLIRRRRKKSE